MTGAIFRFVGTAPGMICGGLWCFIASRLDVGIGRLAGFYPLRRAGTSAIGNLFKLALVLIVFLAGMWLASALTWLAVRMCWVVCHRFPPCASGRCDRSSYGWIVEEPFGWEQKNIFRYFCRCRDEYLRFGSRFYRLKDGSIIEPFMSLDSKGIWVRDGGAVDPILLTTERDIWAKPKVPPLPRQPG